MNLFLKVPCILGHVHENHKNMDIFVNNRDGETIYFKCLCGLDIYKGDMTKQLLYILYIKTNNLWCQILLLFL